MIAHSQDRLHLLDLLLADAAGARRDYLGDHPEAGHRDGPVLLFLVLVDGGECVVVVTLDGLVVPVALPEARRDEAGQRRDAEEAGGHVEGNRVGVGGVLERAGQRRAEDAGGATEEDQQPEGVGELVQAEQVDQDYGRKRNVSRCKKKK